MNPFLSWGIVFVAVGGYWLLTNYKKTAEARRKADSSFKKGSSVYVKPGSGPAIESDKKKKRKKAAQQPKKPQIAVEKAPEVITAEEEESDDHAEDDSVEMVRRLAQLRSGNQPTAQAADTKKPQAPRFVSQKSVQKDRLQPKPAVSPLATASSTGDDADIDEELLNAASPSGGDPTDMLESTPSGPRVLTITPSTAPPRVQRQRNQRSTTPEGAQYSKNQKKKERAKAAKEEERRQQEAAREKYRAEQKAEGILSTRDRQRQFKAGNSDAWTIAGSKSKPKPAPSASNGTPLDTGLLDTFSSSAPAATQPKKSEDGAPAAPGSEFYDGEPVPAPKKAPHPFDEPLRPPPFGMSVNVWEDVPAIIMSEPKWDTVPVKRKGKSDAGASDAGAKKEEGKGKEGKQTGGLAGKGSMRNGFEALSDSQSDWAKVEAESWDEKAW